MSELRTPSAIDLTAETAAGGVRKVLRQVLARRAPRPDRAPVAVVLELRAGVFHPAGARVGDSLCVDDAPR
jgi:uncharacterized membrane protein (UPF0127 family)